MTGRRRIHALGVGGRVTACTVASAEPHVSEDWSLVTCRWCVDMVETLGACFAHPPIPFDDHEVPTHLPVAIPDWRWEQRRRWQRETDIAFAHAVIVAAAAGEPLPYPWTWTGPVPPPPRRPFLSAVSKEEGS